MLMMRALHFCKTEGAAFGLAASATSSDGGGGAAAAVFGLAASAASLAAFGLAASATYSAALGLAGGAFGTGLTNMSATLGAFGTETGAGFGAVTEDFVADADDSSADAREQPAAAE